MNQKHYYNDFDKHAAAWLKQLIVDGHLPDGDVDERSILEVAPSDLVGYRQCHFFAGIGGWPLALRLAGWPPDWPIWTGSPPCQPFSAAGKGAGREDERHLAPHFAGLIDACRPGLVVGEQVASAAVLGKAAGGARAGADGTPEWAWLDDLSARLESAQYAVAAADLPAAGVGAPHIRQRIFWGGVRPDDDTIDRLLRYWMAYSDGWEPRQARRLQSGGEHRQQSADSSAGGLGHGVGPGLEGHGRNERYRDEPGRHVQDAAGSVAASGAAGRVADASGEVQGGRGVCGPREGQSQGAGSERERSARLRTASGVADGGRGPGGLGHAHGAAGERNSGGISGAQAKEHGARDAENGGLPVGSEHAGAGVGRVADPGSGGLGWSSQRNGAPVAGGEGGPPWDDPTRRGDVCCGKPAADALDGFWVSADWLFCTDGKWRPVEPGTFPLADGIPGRVGLLRGYGNAIVPAAGAAFVESFLIAAAETYHG